MPKDKIPESADDKEQSERFIETARQLGADATLGDFEEKVILVSKKRSSTQPSTKKVRGEG